MTIHGTCPACALPLQLPDNYAGRQFQCARCGGSLAVTTAGQVIGSQAAPGPDNPDSSLVPANPFADLPAGNPYQATIQTYAPAQITRQQALAKVRVPGLLLQVYGAIWIIAAMFLPAAWLSQAENAEDPVLFYFAAVITPLGVATGLLAFVGGTQMKALRAHGLVLASVIVTSVAGLFICPPLALVGLYPLIVLFDGSVRNHFGRSEASVAQSS